MPRLFTGPDAWSGGHYELAIEFRSGSLGTAHAARIALWSHPNVGPCYLRGDLEPNDQPIVDVRAQRSQDKLFATCVLGDGVPVPAVSHIIPYDQGPVWFYFGFPMAGLSRAYSVGAYPFDDRSDLGWRAAVDEWLRALAVHVFARVPFDCALIGHEPDEETADEITRGGIPTRRWEGILWPGPDGLAWHPPTEGPPFTFDD